MTDQVWGVFWVGATLGWDVQTSGAAMWAALAGCICFPQTRRSSKEWDPVQDIGPTVVVELHIDSSGLMSPSSVNQSSSACL